jgi:glycosyltransferase involved in cell wall biosynthesis
MSLRTSVPTTLVIHDLAYEHHPEYINKLSLNYYKHFSPKYSAKASRIATVSEFSKNDLITTYKTDPEKIDVIHNGADDIYEPISISKQAETRRIYSKGKDYFLFVGAIQPRKNLANLLRAFDQFKKTDDKGIQLMLAGRKGWSSQEIFETYEEMNFKEDVIFTGRVSNKELKHLYGSALALTYISYFEGFGIPVIEAQQCACPVITSNCTSMPEVASDSALLVDPFSINSISDAMNRVSKDETLRADLINKGTVNAKRFSWEKTADS